MTTPDGDPGTDLRGTDATRLIEAAGATDPNILPLDAEEWREAILSTVQKEI